MIKLSPTSGLNLFQECPRYFWFHHKEEVHRPRGPFPSLPGGIDRILRTYYEKYVGKVPSEIEGQVDGVVCDNRDILDNYISYTDEKRDAMLRGKLDECLIDGDTYIPLDFKTRTSAPPEGSSEQYYQTQLDTYAFLLQSEGYKVSDHAFLVYYFPEAVKSEKLIQFDTKVVRLDVKPRRSKKIFEDAVDALNGPLPEKHSECKYCNWGAFESEEPFLQCESYGS